MSDTPKRAISVTQGEIDAAIELEAMALAEYHKRRGVREWLQLLQSRGGDVVKAEDPSEAKPRVRPHAEKAAKLAKKHRNGQEAAVA